MKIDRKVGAGAHGALPADVRLVQIALGAIIISPNTKAYYDGAVDGRDGPKTQSAIRAFQSDLGITPTGAVEPISQTMNMLVNRTPSSIKDSLSKSGGGSAGATGTQDVVKVREYGGHVSAHAEGVWALPREEATDLAKSIRSLASDSIIPLAFDTPPVSLTSEGHFKVTLRLPAWASEGPESAEEAQRMMAKAAETITSSGLWRREGATGLTIKTQRTMPMLTGLRPPEGQQLDAIGLAMTPKDPVLAACCAALCHNDCDETKTFLRSLPDGIHDREGKKLVEAVKKPTQPNPYSFKGRFDPHTKPIRED